ncbi:MAG: beta-galactosidase, partial [Phycisphaerae bacterium]|nr:beta-galactosidase [Phycisphaerae bacterium]
MVTEFRSGGVDFWSGDHQACAPATAARRAMEIVGCGAMLNYSMFHGGTNFGFYGSRLALRHESYQTTSYDADAPIAEGGGLTEKYYLTRLVNLTANHMGPWLAQAALPEEPTASLNNATDVETLTGPHGNWVSVSNHGRDDVERVEVVLPTGTTLDVALATLGAAVVPWELELPDGQILDYSTLVPLGFFGPEGKRLLVLRGPAGETGEVSLDGKVARLTVPTDDAPRIEPVGPISVVLVHNDLAMRTWPIDDESIIFGPDYVGSTDEELIHSAKAKQYYVLSLEDGKLSTRKVKADTTKRPPAPRLDKWERIHICPEPVNDALEWKKLDRPRDVDRIGCHYGYTWYRLDIPQERARKRNLLLPECGDRAMLYLNGEPIGIWGKGPDATREPMAASFKKGENALVALVDNLGRYSTGPYMDEPKGLYGHIWDAKALRTSRFKVKSAESFPKRIIPRTLSHVTAELDDLPLVSAELSIPLTKPQPVHMTWTDIPHHMAVFVNDRPIGFYPKLASNWGDLTLGAGLKKGRNTLQILAWGEPDSDVFENFRFYNLLEPVSADGPWHARPWTMPGEVDSAREPIKNKPCWYATTFQYTPTTVPLFVSIGVARKGQIFLNGHNLGRFWEVGPQPAYYLPEAWLEEGENELQLFEEQGNWPQRCKLEYRPLGPYRE